MSLSEYLSADKNTGVSSEEILNVLRRSDDLVLGTATIAEAIDMSSQGAKDRLFPLEEDGRVVAQRVGNSDTLVWGLHPNERQEPVPPEIARLVKVFKPIRETLRVTKSLGGMILLTGFGIMFAGLTGAVVSTTTGVVSNSWLVAVGYAVAASGGGAWLVGGAVVYGTIIAERVARWKASHKTGSERENGENSKNSSRGQLTVRMVLGTFVVAILAPSLLILTEKLQSSLASTAAFSPVEALFIALLFTAAIVAAIFEK